MQCFVPQHLLNPVPACCCALHCPLRCCVQLVEGGRPQAPTTAKCGEAFVQQLGERCLEVESEVKQLTPEEQDEVRSRLPSMQS